MYNEPTQLPSSDSKNPILAVDERNTENVRSGYHHQSLNTRRKILEACVNADWVYSVDSVPKIKSIVSFIFHAIYGAVYRGYVYSAYPFLLWWLWEYVYFMLLS